VYVCIYFISGKQDSVRSHLLACPGFEMVRVRSSTIPTLYLVSPLYYTTKLLAKLLSSSILSLS